MKTKLIFGHTTWLCALPFVILLDCAAFASVLATIDQQNVSTRIGTGGATAPFSFGQSFTPTLHAVDAIEFLLGGDNATVTVRLRDSVAGYDGLDGNILAESSPVIVNQLGNIWFQFDFPNRVPLSPGHEYVAEIWFTTGSLGVRAVAIAGDSYVGGQLLEENYPTALFTSDLIFREGLYIPEPTSHIIFSSIGLFGFAMFHLRRGREKAIAKKRSQGTGHQS